MVTRPIAEIAQTSVCAPLNVVGARCHINCSVYDNEALVLRVCVGVIISHPFGFVAQHTTDCDGLVYPK